jgi:hypothetical protein
MPTKPTVKKDGDITIISPAKPPKPATRQTMRDEERLSNRCRRAGPLFVTMHQFLTLVKGKLRYRDMLSFAKDLAQPRGLKIDRLAQRTKNGLICWFCENYRDLLAFPRPSVPSTAFNELEDSGLFEDEEE